MLSYIMLLAAAVVPLSERVLTLPVAGVKPSQIMDTFNDERGGRQHLATDIMAPRGTPVVAVEDGVIKKLFLSKPGGMTIYEFDYSETYCYYYAHLDGYEPRLKEGMHVKQGQVIGYVGSTGNAPPNSPHLHFGISVIGPDKKWWGGTPVNPYPVLMESAKRQHLVGQILRYTQRW